MKSDFNMISEKSLTNDIKRDTNLPISKLIQVKNEYSEKKDVNWDIRGCFYRRSVFLT